MYNDINIIYGRQFGVVLHLKYVEIRTGFTAEDWNDKPVNRYSGDNRATGQCTNGGHDSTSTCNDGISNSLNQLGEWRLNSAPDAGLSNDKKGTLLDRLKGFPTIFLHNSLISVLQPPLRQRNSWPLAPAH